MKIAFIFSAFPAITETFILNQITGFLDMGHDVHIFASLNPGQKLVHEDVYKYHLMEKTTYPPQLKQDKWTARFKAIRMCLRCLLKSPIRTLKVLICFLNKSENFSYKKLFLAMAFTYRRFDILYCHFGYRSPEAIMLKKMGLCDKTVIHFHAFDLTCLVADKGKDYYKEVFDRGDLFLGVSEYAKKRLIELGCPRERIKVHHMGANPELFTFRKRQLREDKSINLLTVGRFVEKKGIKYALKAFAKTAAEHPDINFRYTIVGEGPLESEIKLFIEQLNIGKYLQIIETVDHKNMAHLFDETDIFILTSITAENGDQEGVPTVLIEAACSGIPIISTHHAGIPEVVVDGQSGFLVSEKDFETTAEKLSFLVENPQIWPQMSIKAREHFEKYFDINKLNRDLVGIFESLCRSINIEDTASIPKRQQ